MKKLLIYLMIAGSVSIVSCKGNSSGQTGGAQADSGATNVGSSGAASDTGVTSGSGSPTPAGTGGTDTSGNGKGTTNPTVDTLKTNP